MHIGDRLREARKKEGLTAKKLSELSAVPEKTIYRIETGEVKDPKISSIAPLIKVLDCSADEIIFDAKEFTSLGSLKQAFIGASKLPPEELNLILEIIRKVRLATGLENEISKHMHRVED